ncbi:hypothetical protein CKO45_24350 [Paracraurococcus ruber]|uniref:Uncharacterized protein n=1 Tax=Paracraurococcus ruber TaxID=77675 RepID=A0ABS1D3B3_9PROT|nr:hypothetical protein [Paracraurococcus ruber]
MWRLMASDSNSTRSPSRIAGTLPFGLMARKPGSRLPVPKATGSCRCATPASAAAQRQRKARLRAAP